MKVGSYFCVAYTARGDGGRTTKASSQSQVSELRLSLYRVILNSESSSSHQFENEQQFGEIAGPLAARPLERVIEYADSSRQYSRSLSTTSEHSERFLAVFQWRPRGPHSVRVELGCAFCPSSRLVPVMSPAWLTESRAGKQDDSMSLPTPLRRFKLRAGLRLPVTENFVLN